jgi:hypothetical protein
MMISKFCFAMKWAGPGIVFGERWLAKKSISKRVEG